MVKRPEVLAIIPARGGSKGIPRKNVRDFAGAPLVAYSIVAALRAETVTRVIVSTDDEEIARVAREWGAEVPFMRPVELAADTTQDYPVILHALQWLEEREAYQPQVTVQLRPTSPVRPLGLIDEAVNLLLAHPEADCVRGVVPSGQNPHKMWKLDGETGRLLPLLSLPGVKEPYNSPRQELPPTYWQTGHIDAIRTSSILEKESLTGDVILPVMIDPRYTVDIDTPADLQRYARLMVDPGISAVDPLNQRRRLPEKVSLLVMDFDGVLTDDRVYIDENGTESVRCSRSDGYGITLLRDDARLPMMILSREVNPVVSARGKKLKIEVYQGSLSKEETLREIIRERGLDAREIVYVGNDLPDLAVLPVVGCFACPSDAHPQVLRQADLVLEHKGGQGAIRELAEILLDAQNKTHRSNS